MYVPFLGPEAVSEETARIHALAAAQNYSATTVLVNPLVVYLDDFLSAAELDDLLNSRYGIRSFFSYTMLIVVGFSAPLFVPSQVYSPDDEGPQHRTSHSCTLPSSHPLASIISTRALQFLENFPKSFAGSINTIPLSYYGLENLQLVKYLPSQYYHHHMDWFDALIRDDIPGKGERGRGRGRFYNRVASFFVYLEDACTGGMTEFPDLKFHASNKSGEFWDERITFGRSTGDKTDEGAGIAFKPRKGSGVFWVNLQESGLGDDRVRHAALPVEEGTKVGMNIWVKRDFGW